MAFDRQQYGMNGGIPFIKIANRVEVTVNLNATRISGPPVTLMQSQSKFNSCSGAIAETIS
jgi:hypothetical protein